MQTRSERLRELIKQKEAIDTELATIKKQLDEETSLLKKERKPRKKKQGELALVKA